MQKLLFAFLIALVPAFLGATEPGELPENRTPAELKPDSPDSPESKKEPEERKKRAPFDEITPSTAPIGSHFYRHLAFDFGHNVRELVKFEKKGFGHAEIVTLVLISSATGKPLIEYGKRRIKEQVELKVLAQEAGLDYPTLYKIARIIKEGIENKDGNNLPPAVFEKPAEPAEKGKKKKRGKEEDNKVTPTASPAPAVTPPPPPLPNGKSELD